MLACAASVLWIALVVVTMGIERASGRDVPTCAFKLITGRPCPSCGSTRAALALARGDVGAAVAWNPLFVLLLLALPVIIARGFVARARGDGEGVTQRDWGRWRLATGIVLVVAANWAYVLWHGN